MSSPLRIVTWNCRSGSVEARLSNLAAYRPDVVFLQECRPVWRSAPSAGLYGRRLKPRKGVAMVVAGAARGCSARQRRPHSGRAAIAVAIDHPRPFVALGIWAQGPDYVDDVLRTLRSHAALLRSRPAIVFGDFNSGTSLSDNRALSAHHRRLLDALHALDLVSAYHAFRAADHGREAHATYFHQFDARKRWHIDFCFVHESWASKLTNVTVIDGRAWRTRSDHLPLLVDIDLTN
jgi:endonuclease/exonuclease/phosphatase family metal-dependent hydrolase